MSNLVSLAFPRPTPEIAGPPNLPKYAYPGLPVEHSSIYPPPDLLLKPDLPSGQRKPIWGDDSSIPYNLTTHIVPAAYFREDEDIVLPDTPTADGTMTKEERNGCVQRADSKLREIRNKYEETGRKPQHKALWLCLNRYVRTSKHRATGGSTLFFAHANGFHKETWEPTILSLLSSQESQSHVQEIWVWEACNHGDSALLNSGKLNSLIHTRTAARDLLNFLIYFLPSTFDSSPLPIHIPRVAQAEVQRRFKNGFTTFDSPRYPICAVGHSFGGAISTLAAISHPSLFASLFLVDPVITYPNPETYHIPSSLALGALSRRASWQTREAARKGFLESSFFRAWDPQVLDLYLETALYRDQDMIRLKTSPIQEAIVFVDAGTGAPEAWVRLWRKELDPRIKLRWAMPGPGKPGYVSLHNATQQRVWLRPENCSNICIEGSGHLIAQEKPSVLGTEIAKFLKETPLAEKRARL
ncbi:alpha beta-hydrolase [Lentinula aciculospora]|uniref:Alpha beta-hydrolase n=1 Tax=Lentinula aciculospora TaxID=153920 RepID=A0A9W9AU38_9AGAR|nr:alpha beta-hydrolase [Lentinula aciculospora]